jgi:hypothetical protein
MSSVEYVREATSVRDVPIEVNRTKLELAMAPSLTACPGTVCSRFLSCVGGLSRDCGDHAQTRPTSLELLDGFWSR